MFSREASFSIDLILCPFNVFQEEFSVSFNYICLNEFDFSYIHIAFS